MRPLSYRWHIQCTLLNTDSSVSGRFQSYMRILEGIPGGENFVPDALSMAKSLGGGFPIGAFWVRDKYQVYNVRDPEDRKGQ